MTKYLNNPIRESIAKMAGDRAGVLFDKTPMGQERLRLISELHKEVREWLHKHFPSSDMAVLNAYNVSETKSVVGIMKRFRLRLNDNGEPTEIFLQSFTRSIDLDCFAGVAFPDEVDKKTVPRGTEYPDCSCFFERFVEIYEISKRRECERDDIKNTVFVELYDIYTVNQLEKQAPKLAEMYHKLYPKKEQKPTNTTEQEKKLQAFYNELEEESGQTSDPV